MGDILAIERDGSMITLDSLDPKDDHLKLESIERTEEIQINSEGQTTQIRTLLNENQKCEIEKFLKDNYDIFTLSTVEMPGISLIVICHSLNVNPTMLSVMQKKKKIRSREDTGNKERNRKAFKN